MLPVITLAASSCACWSTHSPDQVEQPVQSFSVCVAVYVPCNIYFFLLNLVFLEKRFPQAHRACVFPSLVAFEPSNDFQVNGTKEVSAIIKLLAASWK